MKNLRSRRRFLMQLGFAATTVPVLGKLGLQNAQAALPKLSPDNAQAKALSYAEDAASLSHPMMKPGSSCANCQLYTAGTSTCAIFPGSTVAPTGWCTAWAKKA